MMAYEEMEVYLHKESINIPTLKHFIAVIIGLALYYHHTNKQFIQFYISEAPGSDFKVQFIMIKHPLPMPPHILSFCCFSPKKVHACSINATFF
jgi:hypothetical protein